MRSFSVQPKSRPPEQPNHNEEPAEERDATELRG